MVASDSKRPTAASGQNGMAAYLVLERPISIAKIETVTRAAPAP
jgi:hypothetical protein